MFNRVLSAFEQSILEALRTRQEPASIATLASDLGLGRIVIREACARLVHVGLLHQGTAHSEGQLVEVFWLTTWAN